MFLEIFLGARSCAHLEVIPNIGLECFSSHVLENWNLEALYDGTKIDMRRGRNLSSIGRWRGNSDKRYPN